MAERHEAAAADRLADDEASRVIAAYNEEARRLRIATARNVPDEVDSSDGIAVVEVLWKARLIDIHQENLSFDFRALTSFKVNKKGRVVSLTIGNHNDNLWNLHEAISRLKRLNTLNLRRCRRFPKQLDLPKIKWLILSRCSNELIKTCQLATTKLPKLKILQIQVAFDASATTPLIAFLKILPKLNVLYFIRPRGSNDRESRDFILQLLRNECAFLSNRLASIGIEMYGLTETDAEILLTDVLPKFSKLKQLYLRRNQIQSVRAVVAKIEKTGDSILLPLSNSIEYILLNDNPVMERVNADAKEKGAFLTLLGKFKRVDCVGVEWKSARGFPASAYGPEIEYALRINKAGRILVERSADGDGVGLRRRRPPNALPLSAWPVVLERAYKNSQVSGSREKNATGLYYLLRHGPIVEAIGSACSGRQTQEETVESNETRPKKKMRRICDYFEVLTE